MAQMAGTEARAWRRDGRRERSVYPPLATTTTMDDGSAAMARRLLARPSGSFVELSAEPPLDDRQRYAETVPFFRDSVTPASVEQ